ncbi:MAG: hypothetical protein QOJ92_845 [Frankiales bacterium]|nr:hypothetical protein [Frankiales bacterium]
MPERLPACNGPGAARLVPLARLQTVGMVSALLSVTFACGVIIAVAHVLNRGFVAPVYDVLANLVAFGCAVAASVLLDHTTPALLSAFAVLCWLVLARRTFRSRAQRTAVTEPADRSADHMSS